MNVDWLEKDLSDRGIPVTEEQLSRFSLYGDLLLDWNTRMNLTRITDPKAVCRLHFLDSLSPMLHVSFDECSLIDVGTGAGFPGIPLKIMNPDMKLTLLDALDKRCNYLREVTTRLSLTDVDVIHGRAEDAAGVKAAASLRGQFDFAVSRAVARLNILSEYAVPFLRKDGMFIAYKSDDGGAELEEAAHALSVLGAVSDRSEYYEIPGCSDQSPVTHVLHFIRAVSSVPDKYPRRAGMPEKKPL